MGRGPHPAAIAKTPPEARRGRSPFDRFIVRFPGLIHAATRMVFRLPPGSRARQAINRAAISRLTQAYNRRDWELNTIAYDPSYVLTFGASTDRPAGARDQYVGVDGLMEFLDLWHDVWGDFEFHLEDVLDAGPNRLLLLLHQSAHGRDTLAMNERTAMVSQFSDGRVVRQVFWRDRAAALAAEGVEPPK